MSKEELDVDLARTAVVMADTRLPEAYLVAVDGALAGRRFRLHKSRMVIGAAGRGADNDIEIDLPTLSARHAALELSVDGTVRIWDLSSSNGTYLNDQAIPQEEGQIIKSGDIIALGPDLTFTLKRGGDESSGGSVSAARRAIGTGRQHQQEDEGQRAEQTVVQNTPPGISSDVPLGKILGYLVSGGIISCTLFGLLNDAFDFVGLVQGFFGGGG